MIAQKDRLKKYAKVVLIISCIFAVISGVLLIIAICGFPQAVKHGKETKYLYENGVEVDAQFKGYYDDYGLKGSPSDPMKIYSGRFHLIYEYVDANGNEYTDEYSDTVKCRTRSELRAREQVIKKMIVTDWKTMKMVVADNGLCRLSVYKESLLKPTTLIIYIIIASVSSVVLGLCIFGIVRQTKKIKRYSY